jgi:hypothetical protein
LTDASTTNPSLAALVPHYRFSNQRPFRAFTSMMLTDGFTHSGALVFLKAIDSHIAFLRCR